LADNKPAYTVRVAEAGGTTRFFAAFEDGNGTRQEIEIDEAVYLTLDACRLIEKGQENERGRHWERLELSEAQLAARTFQPPTPMEEAVAQSVDMQSALTTLTDTQRRRFLLYHEYGLNHDQIATVESCKRQAVTQSIAAAAEKIKLFFEGALPKGGLSEE